MIDTIIEKWSDILLFLREQFDDITEMSYVTWLQPLKPYKVIGDKLYIIASDNSNPLIVDIVSRKYRDYLSLAILKVSGLDLEPIFIIENDKDKIDENSPETFRPQSPDRSFNELLAEKGLNPKYTFYSFVSGKSNELAHAAALAVAENPGNEYKILYIYGGVGLGKTHLMHAIGIYVLKNNPNANVIYASSETFTSEYVDSIVKKNSEDFRRKYRTADVLMIDDIQFIANKEGTQEEFFNTFNTLFNNNKQIVITSDKPPKDINNLEERIRSRFEGGMIVDIIPPNYETRMAILRKKEEIEGYNIDDEVLKYIATNIKSNIRTLEGALQRIVLKSRLEKNPIDVKTASLVLVDVITDDNTSKVITPEKIISVVADHYSLRESDLISVKKNKDLSYPRQIVMYLCCELTDATQKTIGNALGGRDHATVLHGRNKIAQDIKKNEKLRIEIELIKKKLSP